MTAHDNPQSSLARSGKGKFIRTIDKAETDAEAARLYAKGYTYKQIGEHLNLSKTAAIRAVQRAVREVVQDAGEEALRVQVNRLEYLFAKTVEIVEADHVVVSHGHIVYGEDGQPLRDHGPVLSAIREARQCLESFQSLTGMKQPTKIEHSGGVKYELVGVDPQDLA